VSYSYGSKGWACISFLGLDPVSD